MPSEDTRVTLTLCLSPYRFSVSFPLRFYLRYVGEERWRADFSHGKSEKDALLRREQLFSLVPRTELLLLYRHFSLALLASSFFSARMFAQRSRTILVFSLFAFS